MMKAGSLADSTAVRRSRRVKSKRVSADMSWYDVFMGTVAVTCLMYVMIGLLGAYGDTVEPNPDNFVPGWKLDGSMTI